MQNSQSKFLYINSIIKGAYFLKFGNVNESWDIETERTPRMPVLQVTVTLSYYIFWKIFWGQDCSSQQIDFESDF